MPRTIGEFILREIWHGAGDISSFNAFIRSKVAILSVIFLALHLVLLASFIFNPKVGILMFLVISLMCIVSSLKKYHYAPLKTILQNTVLFYFYFWGRALSIIIRLLPFIYIDAPRSGRTS